MHRCSIFTFLKTRILFRALAFAFLGLCPIAFFGLFADVDLLSSFGLIAFLTGICFIALGFVPFKRLNQLQLFPYELILTQDLLILSKNNKALLSILLKEIKQAFYTKSFFFYGIALKIDTRSIDLNRLRLPKKWKKQKNYDVMLPFFSEKAFLDLKEHLKDLPE